MKSSWSKAVDVVTKAAAAVVKAITPTPPHVCGFNCDCERRAFYNAGGHRGGGRWIPRRPGGWLR